MVRLSRTRTRALALLAALSFATAAFAAPPDDAKKTDAAKKPGETKPAGRTFITLPVLPSCAQLSADHGDPFKGAATIFLKASPGCKIAWHWHSVGESLLMVSGHATLEMKGADTHKLASGDYLYLAAKGIHQFTCTDGCTLFDVTEGAFDIHYVDKDGKELPVEQVIKPAAKPAAPPAAKAEKKK